MGYRTKVYGGRPKGQERPGPVQPVGGARAASGGGGGLCICSQGGWRCPWCEWGRSLGAGSELLLGLQPRAWGSHPNCRHRGSKECERGTRSDPCPLSGASTTAPHPPYPAGPGLLSGGGGPCLSQACRREKGLRGPEGRTGGQGCTLQAGGSGKALGGGSTELPAQNQGPVEGVGLCPSHTQRCRMQSLEPPLWGLGAPASPTLPLLVALDPWGGS